jgi:hypothetical protein
MSPANIFIDIPKDLIKLTTINIFNKIRYAAATEYYIQLISKIADALKT